MSHFMLSDPGQRRMFLWIPASEFSWKTPPNGNHIRDNLHCEMIQASAGGPFETSSLAVSPALYPLLRGKICKRNVPQSLEHQS